MLKSEFIPARDPSSKALLIALHGLGDSAAGWRFLPPTLGLPWLNCLLVNAPDPYYGGFSWYEFSGEERRGIERSRKLLFTLLDAQRAAGFPSEQTTLLGFSQGCLMTADVGFRFPRRFAGLVGISGWVHEPEKLLREKSPVAAEQRMLFTHGTLDPLVPCASVREQVRVLRAAGLSIEWRDYPKAHTLDGAEELPAIRRFIAERCLGGA
jgi:phospholipase/carboxylesterase